MAVTRRGNAWEIKKSLWIIWSFIFLLNGIGMFYAGKKVRVKKWVKYGLLYIVSMWLTIIISAKFEGSVIQDILMTIFFVSYIACIIHSFIIRKEYLIRLEIIEDRKIEEVEADILRSKISNEYGVSNSKISTANLSNTISYRESFKKGNSLNNK